MAQQGQGTEDTMFGLDAFAYVPGMLSWLAHIVRHAAAVMATVPRQVAPSLIGDVVAVLQEKLQHAAAQLDTLQQEVQQLSVARVRDGSPEVEYSFVTCSIRQCARLQHCRRIDMAKYIACGLRARRLNMKCCMDTAADGQRW